MSSQDFRIVRIEIESVIKAPRQVVFDALTKDFGDWWPHKTRPDAEVFHENRVGGTLGEKWPDGGGMVYGMVTAMEPGKKVVSGSSGMFGAMSTTNTDILEDVDGGTKYIKSNVMWGAVPEEAEKMIRDGSRMLIEQALKGYCEAKAGV